MLGLFPSAIGAFPAAASVPLAQAAQDEAANAAAAAAAVVGADAGGGLVPGALVFVLCVVGAVGMLLLLPGRREASLRKIGGVVLLAAGLILAALLMRAAAGTGGMHVEFWIFSAIALVGAVRVVTHPKPVYSALYFVLTVMATAGLFVLMWAEFMAAALVLIYAGAILVTYVFVIMLAAEASPAGDAGETKPLAGLAEHDAISREPVVASAVGFALLGVLLLVVFERSEGLRPPAGTELSPPVQVPNTDMVVPSGGTQELGAYLFNRQLVNLELAGLILTLAMVGAIVIARKRVVGGPAAVEAAEAAAAGARTGGTLTAPATPIDDNPHSIPVYGTDNPRQKAYPET